MANILKSNISCNIRFILAVAIICCGHLLSYAQTVTQTIRGTIRDIDSKAPLELVGVTVLNLDTHIIAITDANGKFRLSKVPVGRHSIKASFIGFEDALLQNLVVTSGKEVVLTIEMREKVFVGAEVEIIAVKDKTKANNELVTNSARNFQNEEAERYAGSRGDPAKMVANYAGVATGNDARNDIIVRGNSPLGVLWRLENTDIPSPNHFSTQGATGGPVSILNNNLLGNSDFLTGAFPAEYGNKMSAVFDLKLRNGNNEKTEFTTQLGFNGLEAGVEGPISKKNGSSFLLNYRYSTLKLFQLAGISFGVSGLPQYQDLTFKVSFPTSKAGVFSFWGIGGLSKISILDSEKDTTDWSFTELGEDLVFGSKMGVVGTSHLFFFSDKVSGKLNLSISGTEFNVAVDTLSADKIPFRTFTNNSTDGQYFANYTLTWKLNSHHLLKSGATMKNMFFDYKSSFWSRKYQRYMEQFKDKNNANIIQAFSHWQYRVTDKLTINNGVHFNFFALNNSWALEPRSGFRWQLHSKHSLSASFGMHSQSLPMIYYFYQAYDSLSNSYKQTNKSLDLSKSLHYILGYDFNFAKDFRVKIENYYQNLYNVPVEQYRKNSFSTINVGNELNGITLVDSLENSGTGYNYGTELTVEKFFSRGYYFLNSLSLYDSKYRGSDGVLRNTAFNGGFVYNALGGIEIPLGKKNQVLGFDIKFTYAGGNRFTPIDLQASIQQAYEVYTESEAFSSQFKAYQKLDLKISYRINQKKLSQYIYFHIENVLNHKNVLQQVYNSSKQDLVEEYQLGLFPYGGFRIEF